MGKLEEFSLNGKHGYTNAKGEVVIEPQFDDCIYTFGLDSYKHTEYAPVSLNGKCGIIDESGKIVIPFEYQEVIHLFDDYFAVRKKLSEKEWSYGVIKPDGTVVVPFDYKMITNKGRFLECYKEAYSSRIYTHCLFDVDGRIFKYNGKQSPFIYNNKGELVFEGFAIDSRYDYLIVEKDGKYGVIGFNGKHIVEIEYDDVVIVNQKRFIVRRNDGITWSLGVLDDNSNIIIDFKYKYITSSKGDFFDCFLECYSSQQVPRSNGEKYEYVGKGQEYWLNSYGKEVYQGKAEVLSEKLLACDKHGIKAVINFDGKIIVNHKYNSIKSLENYLVVKKDDKVGVLTDSGAVVIDALYDNIEFVHIDNSVSKKYTGTEVYGCFSKKNVFDTASDKNRLNRSLIQIVRAGLFYEFTEIKLPVAHYSFNDVMILRSSTYAELFSNEEGIIYNSRFDTIQQLTDLSYVVSKDGKYGVYRRDTHRLIIECEYDRIIFEGGKVVLLCKDGLWGAKTLVLPEHHSYSSTKVNVPVEFKEIAILTYSENLFGVKHEREHYLGGTIEEYTIVDDEGKTYEKMNEFWELSSMPVFYDLNHILTSRDEKYGFVSVYGYESVPFIYDEIKKRNDSFFDVRIGEFWGVIDVLGKVIVSIKYDSPIRSDFDNSIVTDALSKRKGVLGADGREKVPAIYEHLKMGERVINCGYGGSVYDGHIAGASWGVLKKDGVPIITPLYDCIEELDGYILAGHDGRFLFIGQDGTPSFREGEYDGVYDLFDYEGNLIIGGFNQFHKDQEHNLLYFHFGGGWKQKRGEWGIYSCDWNEGNGRWLVTDMNLTSIIPKQDGASFTFRKGAKCKITNKKENGKITSYWSFPLEQFSVLKPIITEGCFIIGDNNKQKVIRFKDRASSRFYNKVKIIDKINFFIYERKEDLSGIGISSFEQELISCDKNYSLLTIPVLNYVFAVQKIDDDNYSVLLLSILNTDQISVAIDKIDYCALIELLKKGKLQILFSSDLSENQRIFVRDKSVFNEDFIISLNIEERNDPFEEKDPYWFSVNIIASLSRDNYNYDYNYDGGGGDRDYGRDTWDAMTDGMYGDMPDGFDGDYGFMGR